MLKELQEKLDAELGHPGTLTMCVQFRYDRESGKAVPSGVVLPADSFVYRHIEFNQIAAYSKAVFEAVQKNNTFGG